jgi:hypothetical protein
MTALQCRVAGERLSDLMPQSGSTDAGGMSIRVALRMETGSSPVGGQSSRLKALIYRVKHADHVDYQNAEPRECDRPGFTVRIENDRAEITLKSHYATVEDARAVVEPYLDAWELAAALATAPGEFRLVYDQARVIDRNPTPGNLGAPFIMSANGFFTAVAHSGTRSTPLRRPASRAMTRLTGCLITTVGIAKAERYAAHYCLTALEKSIAERKNRRKRVAARFKIEIDVLNKIGELADNKGGSEARKAKGTQAEFTAAERVWLEETMRRLIFRAAQIANDPSGPLLEQITMKDLPRL